MSWLRPRDDGARPRPLRHVVQGHHTGQTPNGRPSRFPGFDVLREADRWDEPTRRVVLARLERPGPLRFFTPLEAAVLSPLADLVLDQDTEPKVPVVPVVDQRMADKETDGYRFADMPDDDEAWQRSLHALDQMAHRRYGRGFAELSDLERTPLVADCAEGRGEGDGTLGGMPVKRVWNLWMRYLTDAFYRHPWAWNEIGFGGPAYPRGYKAAGIDRREPWETKDQGLDWPAPTNTQRVHEDEEAAEGLDPQHPLPVHPVRSSPVPSKEVLAQVREGWSEDGHPREPHAHPKGGDDDVSTHEVRGPQGGRAGRKEQQQ
ncbi:MAG: gluconate 2-dehydrogenase subunit 3 family protein [Motilibacteraceae bacterium]